MLNITAYDHLQVLAKESIIVPTAQKENQNVIKKMKLPIDY